MALDRIGGRFCVSLGGNRPGSKAGKYTGELRAAIALDRKIGLTERLSAAIDDRRHPSYVTHWMCEMIAQRVYQIACAYEDGNDADALRRDPLFKPGSLALRTDS